MCDEDILPLPKTGGRLISRNDAGSMKRFKVKGKKEQKKAH